MSKQKTQTERVIAAARSYRGITAVDFLLPDVVDGGPPITRLGARLFDAEEEGYAFERIGKRDRCVVYRLASGPDVDDGRREGQAFASLSPGPSERPAAVVSADTLFDPPVAQPGSPYDPMSEAA